MVTYLTPNIIVETICFFIALITLVNRPFPWPTMPVYLFIVCGVEITGVYLKTHHLANQWPYNILLAVQIVSISVMFHYLLKRSSTSKSLILSGLALLVGLYIYGFFNQGFFIYNNTTYTVSSVIYVIYGLYYFYLLLKDDAYINLKFSPEFWWVAGLLLFCFGSTIVNLLHGSLSTIKVTAKHFLPYYIFMVLNWILYGFWAYAFVCKKWLATQR